jgi:hypothetical protein
LAELVEAPASPAGRDALRRLITRVALGEAELSADVSFAQVDGADGGGFADLAALELPVISVAARLRLRRREPELRIILGGAAAPAPTPDPLLVRAMVEARRRLAAYLDPARALTVSNIARREASTSAMSRGRCSSPSSPELSDRYLETGVAPVSVRMILPSLSMCTAITASWEPSGKPMTLCSTRMSSFS